MKKVLYCLLLIFIPLTLQAEEIKLFLNHPNWQRSYSIKNDRLYSEDHKSNADVLFYDGQTLIVKWDQYGTELFKKTGEAFSLGDIREKMIEEEYQKLEYSFQNPFILVNPYERNPLVALIRFPTEQEAKISIRIKGISPAPDITHTFSRYETEHQIPILGLYPNHKNIVEITALYKDGTQETKTHTIQTQPLKTNIFYMVTNKKDTQNHYYFGNARENNVYDEFGYIRFAFQTGRFTYWFDDYLIKEIPTNGISVYDKIGKFIRFIPFNSSSEQKKFKSYDHGVSRVSKNHHLIIGTLQDTVYQDTDGQKRTAYDIILDLDQTGQRKIFDMGHILNPFRRVSFKIEPDVFDWAHTNSVRYCPQDQSLLISFRHIGFIKIDYLSGQLKWIAAPHLQWDRSQRDGKGASLTDKLLTAVDSQGNPLPDPVQKGYIQAKEFMWPINNHDIRTIGNGLYSIYSNNGPIYDKTVQTQNKSAVLIYKIDENKKTIQMVDYYPLDHYAPWASSAVYMPDTNDLFIYSASIEDKNQKYYNKLQRIDTQTKENLFSALLFIPQNSIKNTYHYHMYPISFYDGMETYGTSE